MCGIEPSESKNPRPFRVESVRHYGVPAAGSEPTESAQTSGPQNRPLGMGALSSLGGVWLTVDPIGSRMGKRGRVPKLGF
jgi:hypothetical protein